MAKLLDSKSIYYKDVNLISQPGVVRSRKDVPIEGHRIVVSSMVAIIGEEFIRAVAKLPKELQPTLHIPRTPKAIKWLELCKELGLEHIFVGVGANTPELEAAAKRLGYQDILIDVAHGDSPLVREAVRRIRNDDYWNNVIVGCQSSIPFYALVSAL